VLRFRSVYGTRTLYRDVCQLEPGSWLDFGSEGLRRGRFWDLHTEADVCREALRGASERELVERGRALLTSSVRNRLVADVPVGAFLSGGLDSSLIVASMVACRRPDEPTYTFSVGFAGDRDSELPHARRVADALGTTHTEVPLTEADYMSELADLTGCRDAPLSEPADLAIARMSRVARERVKVVLSGEGSDEVFCGYPKYHFASAPGWLLLGLRSLGAARMQRVAGWARLDPRRTEVALRALTQPSELDRLVQWFSYLERSQLTALLPGLEWSETQWTSTCASQRAALDAFSDHPPAARMQGVDFHTWLPGNLLERGDRMTMASGLEARIPFLDKELIAFGFALAPRFKIRGRVLKWIVREWARDVLPRSIVERPKWGFRVPLAQWFRGSLRDTLNDYLRSPRGLCGRFGTPAAISELLGAHDGGRVDANLALWTLLAAEVWYQDVFLDRDRG
jgi:asparagine synthase (glutamine-hydrolysing)